MKNKGGERDPAKHISKKTNVGFSHNGFDQTHGRLKFQNRPGRGKYQNAPKMLIVLFYSYNPARVDGYSNGAN